MPTAEHPERVAQIGEGRVFYTNPRFEVEAIRQAEGKNAAIQAGLEYASVKTAAELMGLSVAAVRKALGERRIYASFDMIPAQTDKPVCFLKLADIANCWGEARRRPAGDTARQRLHARPSRRLLLDPARSATSGLTWPTTGAGNGPLTIVTFWRRTMVSRIIDRTSRRLR